MNVLIVADKKDVSIYKAVVKSSATATYLGAVSVVNQKFIANIKDKYHPHCIIFDTTVKKQKDINLPSVIEYISLYYAYIKIIVFTSPDDAEEYRGAYTVIKHQISNVQLIDLLDDVAKNLGNNSTLNISGDGSGITERLDTKISEDNLSSEPSPLPQIPINNYVKKKKSDSKAFFVIIVIATAVICSFFTALICLSFTKSNTTAPIVSSTDEIKIISTAADITSKGVAELETISPPPPQTEPSVTEASEDAKISVVPGTSADVTEPTTTQRTTAQATTVPATTQPAPQNESKNPSSSSNNKSDKVEQETTRVLPGQTYVINNNGSMPTANGNKNNSSGIISVDSITMSQQEITLDKNSQFKLNATISPANSTNKIPLWSSSDTSVATVADDGIVTAHNTGTAVITASCGGKRAACYVYVGE